MLFNDLDTDLEDGTIPDFYSVGRNTHECKQFSIIKQMDNLNCIYIYLSPVHCIPQIAKAKEICQRKRGLVQLTKNVFRNTNTLNEKYMKNTSTTQTTAIEYNEHKLLITQHF